MWYQHDLLEIAIHLKGQWLAKDRNEDYSLAPAVSLRDNELHLGYALVAQDAPGESSPEVVATWWGQGEVPDWVNDYWMESAGDFANEVISLAEQLLPEEWPTQLTFGGPAIG